MKKLMNIKVLLAAIVLITITTGITFSLVGVPVLVQRESGLFTIKATFAGAVAATDSANRTIYVMGYTPISGTITVPPTRAVKCVFGGYFAGSGSLAINGPFEATGYVFRNTGTVIGLKEALPELFGENTTPGVTDMTAAWTKAIDSGAMDIGIIPGTTYVIDGLTSNTAGQTFNLTGATLTLKASAVNKHMLKLNGVGSSVIGGTFDGNKTADNSPANVYANSGVFCNADDCTVSDVTIRDVYGIGVNGGSINKFLAEKCTISGSYGYGIFLSSSAVVTGNKALDNDIDMSSGLSFGQGILFTRSGAGDQQDFDVSYNRIIGSADAAMSDQAICIAVRGNLGKFIGNRTKYGAMGISEGGQGTVYLGNVITDLVGSAKYGIEPSGKDCVISGNKISGALYGISASGEANIFDDMVISGNMINSSNTAIRLQIGTTMTGKNITISGNSLYASVGVSATRDITGLSITGNNIKWTGSAAGRGVSLDTPPAAAHVDVSGNTFSSLQRAVAIYSAGANTYTDLRAFGNKMSDNMGSVTGGWNVEGAAIVGSRVSWIGNGTSTGFSRDILAQDISLIREYGVGVPVAAYANGSTFIRTDGGTGSTFYVRENGAWVAK